MISDPTFQTAVSFVLKSEGGYSNDPKDPGGATARGITWKYNKNWLTAHGYTLETFRNLTRDDAIACYYDNYWIPSGSDGLTDADLAYIHLDAAVQHSVTKAKRFLNNLPLNPKNYDFTDGKNKQIAFFLFGKYLVQRLRYYPTLSNFSDAGGGWMNRMADVFDNALGDKP